MYEPTKHFTEAEGRVACVCREMGATGHGQRHTLCRAHDAVTAACGAEVEPYHTSPTISWVTCHACIDVAVPNAVHLANHVDESKVTASACGREGVTVAAVGDRNIYDGALTCPACKEKFCYPCVLTPGKYQGGTCPYCFGDGVDKTPHGAWGDHCAWCASDWKQPCGCFRNACARAAQIDAQAVV